MQSVFKGFTNIHTLIHFYYTLYIKYIVKNVYNIIIWHILILFYGASSFNSIPVIFFENNTDLYLFKTVKSRACKTCIRKEERKSLKVKSFSGEHVLTLKMCEIWICKFKSGNFDVLSGRLKKWDQSGVLPSSWDPAPSD